MTGYGRGKQVRAIDINSEQLAHALNGVIDCLEVLSEASRGDEVVDLAVRGQNIGQASVDTGGVRYVGVVCCDLGDPGSGRMG